MPHLQGDGAAVSDSDAMKIYELKAENEHLKQLVDRTEDDHRDASERWFLDRKELVLRIDRAETRLREILALARTGDLDFNWRKTLTRLVGIAPEEMQPAVALRPGSGCKKCMCCAQWSQQLSGIEKKNAELRNEIHVHETKIYRDNIGVWDPEPFGSEPEERQPESE